MKSFYRSLVVASIVGWLAVTHAHAQSITLSPSSLIYTQDFNSMGTVVPGSSTVPSGWFVGGVTGTNGAVSLVTVANNIGSGTTGTNYNYGVAGVNLVTDRALGSLAANSISRVSEAQFYNGTGLTITNLVLTYDGEQWRDGTTNPVTNSLTVHFSLDGVNFTAMGSSLRFQSPQNGAVGTLDGNAAANRVAAITGSYTTNLAAGTSFYVRWVDVDNSGSDHALAIDNVVVHAYTIPEPSALALVVAGLCGTWLLRRRS
jgi:hypothetical protein